MTSAPSYVDKNYIHTSFGGYNPCLIINPLTGSVIPNCVGFTWGRWRELLGEYHHLYTGDAENCWYNTSDGYARGQDPKLGACICFYRSGGGHTAVVEKLIDENHIITSNSAYGGTRFWTEIVEKIGGVWTRPYSGYTFQGFIYLPKAVLNIDMIGFIHAKRNKKKNLGRKRR